MSSQAQFITLARVMMIIGGDWRVESDEDEADSEVRGSPRCRTFRRALPTKRRLY
jgi:hypothetical protein